MWETAVFIECSQACDRSGAAADDQEKDLENFSNMNKSEQVLGEVLFHAARNSHVTLKCANVKCMHSM